MIYESLTVDQKLRRAFLQNLKPIIRNENGFAKLSRWNGLSTVNRQKKPKYKSEAPNSYFDSLLPKTAGGLWHEILVYCFILKYNIGYIFPLLLMQKPISLIHKLWPPDLIIMHTKTYRFYGIEIGSLKERQSGDLCHRVEFRLFQLTLEMLEIPMDARTCNKWINVAKVIKDFSKLTIEEDYTKPVNEIRCLTECDIYTLDQQLKGDCKFMKFKYKNANWKFPFADNKHHHYHCCLSSKPSVKNKIRGIRFL